MSDEKKITVLEAEARRFPPPKSFVDKAFVKSHDEHMEMWKKSVADPDKFWLYAFFDGPGSAWGIDTLAYRLGDDWTTKVWMNRDGQEAGP